jgi:hypothetical protein
MLFECKFCFIYVTDGSHIVLICMYFHVIIVRKIRTRYMRLNFCEYTRAVPYVLARGCLEWKFVRVYGAIKTKIFSMRDAKSITNLRLNAESFKFIC